MVSPQRLHVGLFVAVAVLVVSSAATVAGDPLSRSSPKANVAPQYTRVFGYDIGEERRYALEPASSLRSGESATWSIILAEIREEDGEVRSIFEFEHERVEVIYDMFGGESGRMQVVEVSGRLTVNRFGFPEFLVIDEQHDVNGGSLSDRRRTTFTFDGERYEKKIRIDGRDWEFNISISNHDDLDLEVPAGLFAYIPQAMRCLGERGVPGRPAMCSGGDPAFANPGLLSLALPLLWEEQVNEKEFLFFMPSGVGTLPGGLMDMNRVMQRERDQLANYGRYFDRTKFEVKQYVQGFQLGSRKMDVWELDGSGEMREVYADEDGRVLRVNLDPHPVTRGSRWIRLLFPAEY